VAVSIVDWKELDDFRPRWDGKLQLLEELFTNIKNSRSPDAPELEGILFS